MGSSTIVDSVDSSPADQNQDRRKRRSVSINRKIKVKIKIKTTTQLWCLHTTCKRRTHTIVAKRGPGWRLMLCHAASRLSLVAFAALLFLSSSLLGGLQSHEFDVDSELDAEMLSSLEITNDHFAKALEVRFVSCTDRLLLFFIRAPGFTCYVRHISSAPVLGHMQHAEMCAFCCTS